mmetsp:Transcript_52395/g.168040  ORF Transcript_52395/g.168040 Transcript_52395/m.168040 type:complete len:338 (-) Transcript_52395:283-1296(-)
MGAGKGHVVDWMCEEGHFPLPDIVRVDPDWFRSELPEWEGYIERDPKSAGRKTHRESGYLVEIAQEAALCAGKNVWIDGSLRDADWYSLVFGEIRKAHPSYSIAIFHVSAPWELVRARAASRAELTGRVVPEADLRASFEQVPAAVARLEPLADFTLHVENGALPEPRLLAISACCEDSTGPADWQEVRARFVDLPLLLRRKAGQSTKTFLFGLTQQHPLLVFSKTYCSYCTTVKKVLVDEMKRLSLGELQASELLHAMELDTLTVENESEDKECGAGVLAQMELARMTGSKLVPQVFISGRHVGGCSDVLELQRRGELEELLTVAVAALMARHRKA